MKKYAVIVAGGEGNRAGGSVPKQFQKIGGVPMLWWSVRAFHAQDANTKIILVLHPGFLDEWDILYSELPEEDKLIELHISCGGRTRLESVQNGLLSVDDSEEALVAVHDAARPLVGKEVIAKGWEEAEKYGAAVPVVDMADSIRRLENGGSISVARKDFVKVQTPQVFSAKLLKSVYSKPIKGIMTDDASVVEASGHTIALYYGSPYNIKITNPLDFKIAEALIEFIS